MLIVLPFYDRLKIFPLVLDSIISSGIEDIQENVKLVVVNNNHKLIKEVDDCIKNLKNNGDVDIFSVHRNPPMAPLDSWFDAIKNFSVEGEAVALIGDDDLAVKGGFKKRLDALEVNKCDFLLCKYFDRLFFYDNIKSFWYSGEDNIINNFKNLIVEEYVYTEPNGVEASFMSNHTYRNSKHLWDGFELAKRWASEHEDRGIPSSLATATIPFYLSYTIAIVGGTINQANIYPVIRGGIVEDITSRQYSGGGSTALFGLLNLDVLSNKVKTLDQNSFKLLKNRFEKAITKGIIGIIFSKDIKINILLYLLKSSNFRLSNLVSLTLFFNVFLLISKIKFLRGFRLKRVKNLESYTNLDNFIKKVSRN